MTQLEDVEARAVALAVAMKEYVARRRPADIRATLTVHRGEDLVACAFPDKHDRGPILRLFEAVAAFLDPDAMALTIESYTPLLPEGFDPATVGDEVPGYMLNPTTGRVWETGEMGVAVRDHDAIGKGWLSEALTVTSVNRAGDIRMRVLPYRYAGRHHLVWTDELRLPPTAEATGLFPETMIQAMNAPSLASEVPYAPEEATRAERDVFGVKLIKSLVACDVVLFAGASQRDRLRVLRESGMDLSS